MKDFFKLLVRFVPPYKNYLVLNIFFNILTAFLTLFSFALIIPILQMLFKINDATYSFIEWGSGPIKDVAVNNFYYYTQVIIETHGQSVALATLAVVLVVMTALKTGSAYLSAFFMIPIRSGIVRDIRNTIYNKIINLPIGFFSSERKGDVMARISGDVTEIEVSVMASLDMLFKNPVLIIFYFGTLIATSWKLTLFTITVLPFMGWIMGRVGRMLKRKSLTAQNQWSDLMSQVEETLGGLRIIKAFNAEGKISSRFHNQTKRIREAILKVVKRQYLAHPMSEFLGTMIISIVVCYGGYLILCTNSGLQASVFIYYILIFYSIINPIKELSRASYNVRKGMGSLERIDKIMAAENPLTSPENAVSLNEFTDKIEYKNLQN